MLPMKLNPTELLNHEHKQPSHQKIMKYNLLTLSLATLAVAANSSLAQDQDPQPAQSADVRYAQATSGGASSSSGSSSSMTYDDRTGTAIVQTKTPTGTTARLTRIATRASGTGRTLVIPKDATDAKTIADVEEDLNVMARILDKAVNSNADKTTRAMGITLSSRSFGAAGAPQNLYLEGYGAVLFLNVNYPLLPPPVADSNTNAKENTSNEWEEARREISQPSQPQPYGAGGGGFGGFGGGGAGGFGANSGAWTVTTPQDYDADKVEELKKDMITALKNAAHIRKLKSDEVVTVVVTGPGTTVGSKTKRTVTTDDGKEMDESATYEGALKTFQTLLTGDRPGTAGPSAKLIIRAKKSDAEAFQKGSLGFDEFRKRVTLILY
jgi:hypothetical protein